MTDLGNSIFGHELPLLVNVAQATHGDALHNVWQQQNRSMVATYVRIYEQVEHLCC